MFNNHIPYRVDVVSSHGTRFMRLRLVPTFVNEQVQFGDDPKLS